MGDFFDDLSSLCGREMSAASKSGDDDRMGGVIEGLATILGRTIARVGNGDRAAVDTMLMGCEQHIATEATGFSETILLLHDMKRARAAQRGE